MEKQARERKTRKGKNTKKELDKVESKKKKRKTTYSCNERALKNETEGQKKKQLEGTKREEEKFFNAEKRGAVYMNE